MNEYGIALNPRAGYAHKKNRDAYETIRKRLGITRVVGPETRDADEFKNAVKRLADDAETIIAIGGDGTLSDVTNALYEQEMLGKIKVAPVLLGSGNALKYSLRQGDDPVEVADAIGSGRSNKVDLVCTEAGVGFMSSIGYEAGLARRREEKVDEGKHPFGSYFTGGIEEFLSYEPFRGTVTIDDEEVTVTSGLSLIVAKHPYYGKRIRSFPDAPEAMMGDGTLYVRLIDDSSIPWEFCKGLPSRTIRGGRTYRAESVKALLGDPAEQQLDGNPTGARREHTYKVLPAAVTLRF